MIIGRAKDNWDRRAVAVAQLALLNKISEAMLYRYIRSI